MGYRWLVGVLHQAHQKPFIAVVANMRHKIAMRIITVEMHVVGFASI
jgi:hypothetical protein